MKKKYCFDFYDSLDIVLLCGGPTQNDDEIDEIARMNEKRNEAEE